MRKFFGGMVLGALVLSVSGTASAQRRSTTTPVMSGARHELGVDVNLAYVKPSNIDGGLSVLTPFDIRYGLMPRSGKMMWEPHVALNFNTTGGSTTYIFTPGVNVLYSNTTGGHRRGMFFTGGAGLVMGDFGFGGGTAFQLNAGVGWRKPYGNAAWRYGVGFQWVSESAELGSFADYIAFGVRGGISLWH